jgi:hypothetical protein
MQLVGPRPERPEFIEALEEDMPNYSSRHLVCPGITGLAQVNQGYDTSITDVRRKLEFDLKYIETASPQLDLMILVWTIPYIAKEVYRASRARWGQFRSGFQSRNPSAEPPPQVSPTMIRTASESSIELISNSLEAQIHQDLLEQHEYLHQVGTQSDVNPTRVDQQTAATLTTRLIPAPKSIDRRSTAFQHNGQATE